MRRIVAGIMLLTSLMMVHAQGQTVDIRSERGYYQLDFENTYLTYVHTDIELCVTLPKGFTISAVMAGSPDFLSNSVVQNRLYLSKVTPQERFRTNLTIHVLTDEGLEKEIYFKIVSAKDAPIVLAIEFQKPNHSEMNSVIEQVKARYQEQMADALTKQESDVQRETYVKTVTETRPWFVRAKKGQRTASHNGATVRLLGMYNTEKATYFLLEGPQREEGCTVFDLKKVTVSKGASREAMLLGHEPSDRKNEIVAIYETDRIPEKRKANSKYRTQRIKLDIEIWSAQKTLKYKAQ